MGRPVLAVVMLAVAGAAGSVVTVAVAALVDRPAVFVGAGLVAAAALSVAGLRWLLRSWPTPRRSLLVAIGTALAVGGQAAALLTPLDAPTSPVIPGARYWVLSTGSRLSYLQVPRRGGGRSRAPVVVLHGGPGIPDLAGDISFFGQLAADGYDVYAYAQLGSGGSTRLGRPAGYGLDRDVADLEQIRRTLTADKLVLVGHSYGATLATYYLAAHPDRVAALVASSPGPLDPADHSGDLATARLTGRPLRQAYLAALAPRALMGYTLLQVNPDGAHRYLGDAEADARNDLILTAVDPSLHCRAAPNGSHNRGSAHPVTGSGFYALQYPQSATASPRHDVRADLAGLQVPVLVFKGGCDYQSWGSAAGYLRVLPKASLVYLPDAGHSVYQDQPAAVIADIRAFLAGRTSLPVPPRRSLDPPSDYQVR